MKYYLILILAFLQSRLSNCNSTGKSSNISNIKWKSSKLHCKNIKCPPIENLLCVRVKSKKLGSKTKDVYMVVFNECELEYIKCYRGYQANLVSMKNCGNHDKLSGHTGKVRSKRSIKKDKRHPKPVLYPFGLTLGLKNPAAKESSKSSDSDNFNKNGTVQLIADNTDIIKSEIDRAAAQGVNDQKTIGDIPPGNITRINDVREDNKQKEESEKGIADDEIETEEIQQDKPSEAEKDTGGTQNEAPTDGTQSEAVTVGTQSEAENPKTDEQSAGDKDTVGSTSNEENPKNNTIFGNQNENEIRLMGHFDYDLTAAGDGVDFNEYQKDCPSFCPARQVMICARCKDGIYRTFMSVCHLKMFNCAHREEKSEMVARYPCILSAPYLVEAPPPKGRVAEPGDVDLVLHYIRCREKMERNRGDPRCTYILKV